MIDDYKDLVTAAATKHGVPYNLLRALCIHESSGDPLCIGDGGNALGLTQCHEGAAIDVGLNWNTLHAAIKANDKQLAAQLGLEIGAAYFAKMIKEFNGDTTFALCAYNQGPTVIKRAHDYAMAVIDIMHEEN